MLIVRSCASDEEEGGVECWGARLVSKKWLWSDKGSLSPGRDEPLTSLQVRL